MIVRATFKNFGLLNLRQITIQGFLLSNTKIHEPVDV